MINVTLETLESKLRDMVQTIREMADPDTVLLFGSHAGGNASSESDLDLLVIVPRARSRRRIAIDLDLALANLGVPKDIIVVTRDDVKHAARGSNPFLSQVLAQGRSLYERG